MVKIRNSGTIINTDYQYSQLISRKIENVVIPSNINIIGGYAFRGSRVKEIYIPENIKTISTSAFENCTYLEKLEFSDNGVTSISNNAFAYCSSLTEVTLPVGLATIAQTLFAYCTSLKKVIIPETVTTVNYAAFQSNTNLSYVFIKGTATLRTSATQDGWLSCSNIRLFDMRYFTTTKDKATTYSFNANNVYLYINVPDNLYDEFTALPNWSALNLKHFVHSCDVNSFEEIANPQEGHYYSLKKDKNYLNPLGEKQIDIRQYVDGTWVEVDIDA